MCNVHAVADPGFPIEGANLVGQGVLTDSRHGYISNCVNVLNCVQQLDVRFCKIQQHLQRFAQVPLSLRTI